MSEAAHDPYLALRHPEYRRFMLAMFAVFVGALIQSTVLGWQVYALTRDPMALGYVGLAEFLPFVLLTLPGGWVADQMDRRTLALLSHLAILASGFWLLALSFGQPGSVWPFYAVQALAGLGRAFFRPCSVALGTELVPREHLQNAATWRTTVFTTSAVAGPALGGLLLGFGSPRLAYGVMAALMVVAHVLILSLKPRPRKPTGKGLTEGLGEGLRFVFGHQLILAALSLDLFAVLFGGAVALLPAFAQDVLGTNGLGFGVLRAAPSAGAIAMSLLLAHRPPLRRAGPTLLWSVALFGLTWILFAYARVYALSLFLLAAGGALDAVSMVVRGTLTQTLTPEPLMGRVLAVNSLFIGSSNELGAFESGLAAKCFGLANSVALGGLMTLLTVGAVAVRAPKLRALKRIVGDAPPSAG